MSNQTTAAAMRRKIERLEAQLQAMQDFIERDRKCEYMTIRRAADMSVRIQQATDILTGKEE